MTHHYPTGLAISSGAVTVAVHNDSINNSSLFLPLRMSLLPLNKKSGTPGTAFVWGKAEPIPTSVPGDTAVVVYLTVCLISMYSSV